MVLFIILSHYIANIIIALLTKNNSYSHSKPVSNNKDLGSVISIAIKEGINTMLLILGTITFYNIIITSTCSFINNAFLKSLFTGILEFSQGLNTLSNLDIFYIIKAYMAVLFISFGSLSIHTQIKSILIDTNISYYNFFKSRILHVIISFILLSLFIGCNRIFQ